MLCIYLIFVFAVRMLVEGAPCPQSCQCGDEILKCSKKASLRVVPILYESLTFVQIWGGSIPRIKNFSFESSPNLEKLYLNGNNISVIELDAFVGISGLKYLTLANNDLSTFQDRVLRPFHKLGHLLLNGNRLSQIPALSSKTLTKLNLAANKISKLVFPPSFQQCKKLQSVLITSNRITRIEANSFVNVPELTNIDLDRNPIDFVDPRAFEPIVTKLQTLSLDHNELSLEQLAKMLRSFLVDQPKLKRLMLRNSKVKELNKELFSGLRNTKLTELHLDKTRFQAIDRDAFSAIEQALHRLFMSSCNLRRLMEFIDFSRFLSLRFLDLSGNQLKKLPEKWPAQLEKLVLQGNQIQSFAPDAFKGILNLKDLDLRDNKIDTLSPDRLQATLRPFPHIVLRINQNPFECNCELKPFVDWLKAGPKSIRIFRIKKLKCSGNFKGKPLIKMTLQKCPPSTRTFKPLPINSASPKSEEISTSTPRPSPKLTSSPKATIKTTISTKQNAKFSSPITSLKLAGTSIPSSKPPESTRPTLQMESSPTPKIYLANSTKPTRLPGRKLKNTVFPRVEYGDVTGRRQTNISEGPEQPSSKQVGNIDVRNTSSKLGSLSISGRSSKSHKHAIQIVIIVVGVLLFVGIGICTVVALRHWFKMRRQTDIKSESEGCQLLDRGGTPCEGNSLDKNLNSVLVENPQYSEKRGEPIGSCTPPSLPPRDCPPPIANVIRIVCAAADRRLLQSQIVSGLERCFDSSHFSISFWNQDSDIPRNSYVIIASSPSLDRDLVALKMTDKALQMLRSSFLRQIVVLELDDDKEKVWRSKMNGVGIQIIHWKLEKPSATLYDLQKELAISEEEC